MANIKTQDSFNDLGKFKDLERTHILNKTIFVLKFEKGELVLNDNEKKTLTKLMILLN